MYNGEVRVKFSGVLVVVMLFELCLSVYTFYLEMGSVPEWIDSRVDSYSSKLSHHFFD